MFCNVRGALAVFVFGATLASPEPAASQSIGPFTEIVHSANLELPERWNSALLLSDQSNTEKWVFNPALSDEFKGAAIDSHKWLPYDPNTGGSFDRTRAVANADGVALHMRKGPTMGNHVRVWDLGK